MYPARARSLVEKVGREVAVFLQELDHLLFVGGGQFLIERAPLDTLGQQFGDMAAGIVFHLPVLHRLAAFEVVRLQEGAARGVDLNLQRDTQLAAVAEHGLVHRRQPCRAYILVEAFPEGAFLRKAGGELDLGSVADCPVSAADAFPGFEQSAGVAKLAQLIRRGQPGDAATQDDHAGPFAGARGLLDRSRG